MEHLAGLCRSHNFSSLCIAGFWSDLDGSCRFVECCRFTNPTALRYQRGRLERSATCGNEGDVGDSDVSCAVALRCSRISRDSPYHFEPNKVWGPICDGLWNFALFFSRFPRELFSLTYPQRYCGSKQAGRQASKPGGRTASQAASTQASKPNRTQSEIHTLNLPYINPKPSLIKLFEPTSTINKRPKPTLN